MAREITNISQVSGLRDQVTDELAALNDAIEGDELQDAIRAVGRAVERLGKMTNALGANVRHAV